MKFEFLRDSEDKLNFGRIVPFMLFIFNAIYLYVGDLSIGSVFVHCSAFLTGCIIYAFEILRENKRVSVKVNDAKFSAELGGK